MRISLENHFQVTKRQTLQWTHFCLHKIWELKLKFTYSKQQRTLNTVKGDTNNFSLAF